MRQNEENAPSSHSFGSHCSSRCSDYVDTESIERNLFKPPETVISSTVPSEQTKQDSQVPDMVGDVQELKISEHDRTQHEQKVCPFNYNMYTQVLG